MADVTRFQPFLPAEIPLTKAERSYANDQPVIFPENQDSNWGLKRKIFSDQIQALIDQQTRIWIERFVSRAEVFLDEWEYMAGIPENPPNLTTDGRRQRILARIRTGPFTDSRRRVIIEPYITATFGTSVELSPSGVSLVGGIPLMADASGDPRQYYRIYEDVRNFKYYVFVRSDVTPDTASLVRDLDRITPAGIDMVFDNSLSVILMYPREVLNGQPALYMPFSSGLGVTADQSGNGFTATAFGSPVNFASPGLLNTNVWGSYFWANNGAVTFDGVDDYFTVATDPRFHKIRISLEAQATLADLPSVGTSRIILAESPQDYIGITRDSSGTYFVASVAVGGTQYTARSLPITAGPTYHVVGKFTGAEIQLFVNNVKYTAMAGGFRDIGNGAIYIGRQPAGGSFWKGVIDEPALYDREITDAEIKLHYDSARNVAI